MDSKKVYAVYVRKKSCLLVIYYAMLQKENPFFKVKVSMLQETHDKERKQKKKKYAE